MDYYKVTYEIGISNKMFIEYPKDGLIDLIVRLTNAGAKVTKGERLGYKR